jgi:hypothetical protein
MRRVAVGRTRTERWSIGWRQPFVRPFGSSSFSGAAVLIWPQISTVVA